MSVLTPGTTFANGEQLTAADLNLLLQGATFTQSSVDNQSTQLVGTAIVVADGGIIAAKLAADAVTTSKIKDANVTTAKIADANVTFAKLADVIDDDTMATATDTTLATSKSIKAYVDGGFTPSTYNGEESVTLPNGLIMKFGSLTVAGSSTVAVSFNQNFTSGILSVMLTLKTSIPANNDYGLAALSQTTAGFNLANGAPGTETISWMAIGY